ncbi:arylsulfatase [Hufsiella ginkgonis]|uniref:Sulfatase-like hydrolase/transferase n=1 Tax=Hufsiella ginkgonis TaxID=2695274 RepID=A0A7K1Y212_9SPHI|nr:arylsulfatase [Hufsiella ginkgonis]MXV17271.1 sulfatase-like hydrolase/transferase [Hufsiella ginkgonis]
MKNTRSSRLLVTGVSLFTGVVVFTAFKHIPVGANVPAPGSRPNIVVIMADDMGFSDAGCYGGEIRTPNLDYLAKNGIRFTNFYNTSRCCPTRASLLTGLYNHQAGIGKMSDPEDTPGYLGRLGDNTVTLAEVLKAAGYHTAMTGKWHVSNTLGQKDPRDQLDWLSHKKDFGNFSPLEQYPTSRGFERFFGTIWGVIDFFDPFSLVSGTTPIKSVPKDYYHTDAINDTAVAYINSYRDSGRPFFLYVAENAPHWPLQAKPEDIEKYKDTYKAGWDAIREARYKKMVSLGLIDPVKTRFSAPVKRDVTWENNPDKEWDARAMAVHAAMIDRMDQGIGRIIEALRKTGKLDNTLVLFLSDNGASAEVAANYGPGFDRAGETRDGRKVIFATKKEVMPGPQTSYTAIGPRWANVANTPYQYWKTESYEGGLHTPLIAFWPKGITAKKGSYSAQVGHVMDFMRTFTDISGAKYPEVFKGKAITPTPGISLVPSFKGKAFAGHRELFNEHFGARYVRSGNWKMVSLARDTAWHLYDIANDRTELTDVASANPARVKELDSLWKKWANANGVFPKPGRR